MPALLPLVTLALAALAPCVQAQGYPAKTVRIVVPVPPGGSVDTTARLISTRMAESMRQSVVVDNRPGAATNIGTELVARSAPDGYTLLANAIPFAANPAFYPKLPWHPLKDFAAVTLVVTTPHILAVHPSVPAASVKELVAIARSRPGIVKYSSAGAGSNLHIAAELFKHMTGTGNAIVHVPYKGGGPALTALLGGECDVSFLALVAVQGHVAAGKLKAMAVTSARRAAVLPAVPTIAESGVAGYDFSSWVGLFAPAGTPPAVVAAVHEHVLKAVRSPGMKERFDAEGGDIVANTPAQFQAFMVAEVERLAKLIVAAGIKPE